MSRQAILSRVVRGFAHVSGALVVSALMANASAAQAAAIAPQPAPANQGGPAQGVRVSGWWKIDVRNPDGTLVKHLEFENALVGAVNLAAFISGQAVPGSLAITAVSPDVNGPCNSSKSCFIYPADGPDYTTTPPGTTTIPFCALKQCSNDLNVAASGTATTLAGSLKVFGAGSVTAVGTSIALCSSDVAVNTCYQSQQAGNALTAFTLPTPLVLSSGQIVQFSVVLSFS